MRTTVDINDALLARLKPLLHKKNTTMRALIERGLERVLQEDAELEQTPFVLTDGSVDGDGVAESQNLSWDSLAAHLYPGTKR